MWRLKGVFLNPAYQNLFPYRQVYRNAQTLFSLGYLALLLSVMGSWYYYRFIPDTLWFSFVIVLALMFLFACYWTGVHAFFPVKAEQKKLMSELTDAFATATERAQAIDAPVFYYLALFLSRLDKTAPAQYPDLRALVKQLNDTSLPEPDEVK